MYLRALFLVSLSLVFLISPDVALAQANLFEPVAGDKSMVVLGAIFGGLGIFTGAGDPMIAGIAAFNAAVLTLGGLLVSYTILIGTIGTAHDGEMLGKKFSSAWVPIRTALGTSLVLPVIGGGYCIMQALVGWLIVQGVGLADNVWNSFMDVGGAGNGMKFLTNSGIVTSDARAVGYDIFKVLTCTAVINQIYADNKDNSNGGAFAGGVAGPSQLSEGVTQYGVQADNLQKNSCGTIAMPKESTVSTNNLSDHTDNYEYYGLGNDFVDTSKMNTASKNIATANIAATNSLISELNQIAIKMVSDKVPASASQLDTVISKYQNKLNDAAGKEISKMSDFSTLSQNATKDGWFLAGAFYTKMAWYADSVHDATTSLPKVNTPSATLFSDKKWQDASQPYMDLMKQTSLRSSDGSALTAGFGVSSETGFENSEGLDSILAKVIKFNPIFVDPQENPLMALKKIGNFLIGVYASFMASTALIFGASGGVVSNIVEQISTAGTFSFLGALRVILELISASMTFVLVMGVTLAYILPMMPFFLWFGATMGWLVMCIEAILAAPMWAVMHLSPHGDDMVGSGAQGYRLVLSLILRPVLMIFGLIASFIIIQVLGQILTQIFLGAFASAQVSSGLFIKVIGYLIVAPMLYGWAMFVLIKKSFDMIHIIPEEMLKWFGGVNSPQLGNFANTVGGESGGAMAGAALMSQQATGVLSRHVGDGGFAKKKEEALARNANLKESMGNAFGSNAGVIGNHVSELGSGKSSFEKQAFMGKYEEAKDQLGGENSIGGENFDNAFQEIALDPNNSEKTGSEMIDMAKTKALNETYGSGSAVAIQKMSGGSLDGAKFKTTMNDLKNKSLQLSKLQGLSTNDANMKIGTALSNGVKNSISLGGEDSKSLADSVSEEFSKLGVGSSFKNGETNSGSGGGQSDSKDA